MNTLIQLSDFKLIVFDIDGTLVGSSHQIHSYTKKVLLRLHDIGMPFTLATGKILPATKAQADELQIKLPLIFSNGSVLQMSSGEILYHECLPEEVAQKVIRISEERGEDLVIYMDDKIFMKAMNDNIYPIYSMVNSGLYEIGSWKNISSQLDQVTKCLFIDQTSQQNLLELEKVFLSEFSGLADVVHTSAKLVEVMPKDVTKASAVRRLASGMGIRMSEVMAFGDYDNDAPMLAGAGLGICVENGSEAAKTAADLIIGDCEENAPAKFLEALMDAAG